MATIDEADYALEVTRVMDSLEMHGEDATPRAHVADQMNRLRMAIEQRAAAEGIPVGQLSIGLFEREIPNLTRRLPVIVERALAFLRETRGTTTSHDVVQPLEENSEEFFRLVCDPKIPTRIETFTYTFLPGEQPVAALCASLEDRISKKRHRLASDTRPKILALGAFYMTAAPKHYCDAFAGIKADDFAAVLVVHSLKKVAALTWRIRPPQAE